MKRIDRLIIGEIAGPWLFGVAIFTVLIMAGSFLFKITDYATKGVGFDLVMQLTGLLLPGIMAKTFPMAVLLAALLSFGRLSGESEIVAMRAQGVSLTRIMRPVAMFGVGVAILAFVFNEVIVPWAAIRGTEIEAEIKQKIEGTSLRPTSYAVTNKNGKLQAQLMAADFSLSDRTLTTATLVTYTDDNKIDYILNADKLEFKNQNEWVIRGKATLLSSDGQSVIKLENAWPTQMPKPDFTPDDIKAASVKDLDAYSMKRMRELIAKARVNPKITRDQVANLEYGYWNKIALPLAALVYALVGAPLGIRNHRTGAATGFWMAVLIIFAYMMLANFMSLWARGGVIPAWSASFTPLIVGLVLAAYLIHKKN